MFSLALLGEAASDAIHVGSWMLVVALVVAPIFSVAVATVGVWVAARRSPPLAEEMHRDFANAQSVKDDIMRLHGRIDQTNEKIDDVTTMLHRNQQDADLSRGRMEGKLNAIMRKLFNGNSDHDD